MTTTTTNNVFDSRYKYGSVNSNDEESGGDGGNNDESNNFLDKSFDESNLYYYNGSKPTRRESAARAFRLGVPILVAAMLVGGLALWLFRNIGYLYPTQDPSGGGSHHHHNNAGGSMKKMPPSSYPSSSSNTDDDRAVASFKDSVPPINPEEVPTKNATANFSSSSCAAYPKCAKLELTGECCPTKSGVKLNCCS